MWMTEYIPEIKRQFRDVYKFKPSGGTENEPQFSEIPSGIYPMLINGKTDYVKITGSNISCCHFDRPENEPINEPPTTK